MTIMTNISDGWIGAKPYVYGLIGGMILGPIVSNYMGWQVGGGAARASMAAAVVETKATICNARARVEVAEPNKLEWSARNDLAKKFAVMAGAASADSDVTTACSGKLSSAS